MSYNPILPTSRIEFITCKACGCSFVKRVEKDPCSWIFKKGIYCPDCGSKIEDSVLDKLKDIFVNS